MRVGIVRRNWKMKKYMTAVKISLVITLWLCLMIPQAMRNLGLSPHIEDFEKIKNESITWISIRYTYTPENFKEQEIKFVITNPETIKELQKLLVFSRVSAYTTGVNGDVRFCSDSNYWDISFDRGGQQETEVCIQYQRQHDGVSESCVVYLEDERFYKKIFDLALQNNKRLFPQSSPEEISLIR